MLQVVLVVLSLEVPQYRFVVVLEGPQTVGIVDILDFSPIKPDFLELFVEGDVEGVRAAQNVEEVEDIDVREGFDFLEKHDLDDFEGLLVVDLFEVILVLEDQLADGSIEVGVLVVEVEAAAKRVLFVLVVDVDNEGREVEEQALVDLKGQSGQAKGVDHDFIDLLVLETIDQEVQLVIDEYLHDSFVDRKVVFLGLCAAKRQPDPSVVQRYYHRLVGLLV